MKIYEAMKLLDENPSWKFEYQNDSKKWLLYADVGELTGSVFYMLDCWDSKGELMTGTGFGSLHGNLTTSDDWQLVRQPVTWQEAIEAWANGKTVTCKTGITEKFALERYDINIDISHDQIKNGTWYVED